MIGIYFEKKIQTHQAQPAIMASSPTSHLNIHVFNTTLSDDVQVYKELTKGKASPMGGVAYLSLEDSEACYIYKEIAFIVDYSIRNHIMVESSTTQCHL